MSTRWAVPDPVQAAPLASLDQARNRAVVVQERADLTASRKRAVEVEDRYGGATDPQAGLTRIRFSSTVKDYAACGPRDALARIGCDFPETVSGDTAVPYLDMILEPACNVALGAWDYFLYATGNGDTQVVYVAQYCQGQGVAANLAIGMLSHLWGHSGGVGGGTDPYVTEIATLFHDLACNGVSTGAHPFDLALQPETEKYCNE